MKRPLDILAPTRYPWRFNGPQSSRHNISIRSFVPFNKISTVIEGVTIFNPFPLQRFDLVHAFNRIPLGTVPFIIGFESHLPRAFGCEGTFYFRALSNALASSRCRAIIAISDYARRQFLRQHAQQPHYDRLAAKLTVRYPHLPIPPADIFEGRPGEPVRLVFVGNHFGRKGGSVVVRLAERAQQRGYPLHIDIVSSLEMGDASWASPTRAGYWKRDLALLRTLPTIHHHAHLPNAEVMKLVSKAHFAMLPTFSDSFGYSAIEAMICGTPVVATAQCALPEFIHNRLNGILLDLDVDEAGEWKQIKRTDRGSLDYEAMFEREVERLADAALAGIEASMKTPESYMSLRMQARATAEKLFSAAEADRFWDDFYGKVM